MPSLEGGKYGFGISLITKISSSFGVLAQISLITKPIRPPQSRLAPSPSRMRTFEKKGSVILVAGDLQILGHTSESLFIPTNLRLC